MKSLRLGRPMAFLALLILLVTSSQVRAQIEIGAVDRHCLASVVDCETEDVLGQDLAVESDTGEFAGEAIVDLNHLVTASQLSDLTVAGSELHFTAEANVAIARDVVGACEIALGISFASIPFTVSESSLLDISVQNMSSSGDQAIIDIQLAEDDETIFVSPDGEFSETLQLQPDRSYQLMASFDVSVQGDAPVDAHARGDLDVTVAPGVMATSPVSLSSVKALFH